MRTSTKKSEIGIPQLVNHGAPVFALHPHVAKYFPAATMEDARKRITRSIFRGDGPAALIGGAGAGKSLLLQLLAAQFHERFDVVLLACTRVCTRRALLQAILFELGLQYQERDEGQLRLRLLDHLLSVERSPAGLLLLVDEAQALSVPLLDELRVLTNVVRGGVPRVRLVLAGSAALEESFASPELESLSQRLAARCYLAPYSREETIQFVRAQIAAAGAEPERVFAADAWDALYSATDGVPRLVNQLCDRALLAAEDGDCSIIDRQVIQQAWADLQQLPTPWESTRRATSTAPAQVVEFGSLPDEPDAEEFDLVEPTELELEEIDPRTSITAAAPPVAARPAVHRPLPNVASAVGAPPSADPFGEAFDEEEIVIDCFASWDRIVHRGTPRVANERDRKIATLLQAAVAAHPTSSARDDAREQGTAKSVAKGSERVAPIPTKFVEPVEAPRGDRPRLRLADVSIPVGETEGGNYGDKRPSANTGLGRRTAGSDDQVLVVEDEAAAQTTSQAPVRRMAYQHLFSRLRSG